MEKTKKMCVPYTQVANEVLNDKRISLKAKGVYAYMFSKPSGWIFRGSTIAKDCKEERKSVLRAIRELVEVGWIEKKKLSDGHIEYFIKTTLQNPESQNGIVGIENPESQNGTDPKWDGDKMVLISKKDTVVRKIEYKERESTPAQKAVSFFEGITSLKNKAPSNGTAEFLQELSGRVGLGKDVLWREVQAFTSYWTELDKLGKRQRWQLERTFEVEKRLSTWLRRCNERGKPQNFTQKPKYKAGIV